MTVPRSDQIDLSLTPYYHCINRCVRSSYLCGFDQDKNKDFSHRKVWILDRIEYLSSIFSIKICSFTVMSNHYHLIIYVDQKNALRWSKQEVIDRWQKICTNEANKFINSSKSLSKKQINQKVELWRSRLYDISWFMRFLNEYIARKANQEDQCKGRFWEGRFKCQALLDEGALIGAMAYVDLNPIRAGLAVTPEDSDFTSIQERIRFVKKQLEGDPKLQKKNSDQLINNLKQPDNLMSFENNSNEVDCIPFTLSDYIQLVDETGRIIREDKRGYIPSYLEPILERLNYKPRGWLKIVQGLQKQYSYVVGNTSKIREFTSSFLTTGPKGVSASKYIYCR